MSVKLPKRTSEAPPPAAGRDLGTWLALIFCLAVAAGFFGLICLIMPDLIFGVLPVAGLGGMIAIHYFTWGRWLSQMKDDTADE